MINFIEWLYKHNSNLLVNNRIGVYGLDLYKLNASVEAIIKYLEKKIAMQQKEQNKDNLVLSISRIIYSTMLTQLCLV
jgi:erythromycin esterase-like protein